MPRRSQYRLPASSKGDGSPLYWVGAVMLFAIVGWVWWKSGSAKLHEPARGAAPRAGTNGPVVAPTPLPVPPVDNLVARPLTNAPPAKATPSLSSSQGSGFPRPVRDVFEAQLALGRQGISPGSLDGTMGWQTRAAMVAFQRRAGLKPTGELDAETRAHLVLTNAPLTAHRVTTNDLARLQPLSKTWLGKSQQSALDYETILELVAEKGCASPNLVRRINPEVDWTNVVAGTEVQIPDLVYPEPPARAGFAVISLGERKLEAFDAKTNLLAHFPCSIAARLEKRPAGELHVTTAAANPNYTFNPEVFPESAEAQQINAKLVLPPGPNNPVGTAWISLDLPGYGIHGTPNPEYVGRTESHGCFRLANWNAEYLLKLVWAGMPVYVAP